MRRPIVYFAILLALAGCTAAPISFLSLALRDLVDELEGDYISEDEISRRGAALDDRLAAAALDASVPDLVELDAR